MESNHGETLLSVKQQENISLLTQLVIAFGALPFLIPGVGLPVEKRSKFYSMVCPPKDLSIEEVKKEFFTVFETSFNPSKTFPETLQAGSNNNMSFATNQRACDRTNHFNQAFR